MKFEEREAIIIKLNTLEKYYPVDTWIVKDVHIWPLLKKIIFFQIFSERDQMLERKPASKGILKKTGVKINKYFKALFALKRLDLSKVDFIFSGASSHRILRKEEYFNRYFDPMMDYLEKKEIKSFLFEYDFDSNLNFYREDRVKNLTVLLPIFAEREFSNTKNSFEGIEDFESFVNEVQNNFNLKGNFLKSKLIQQIKAIKSWANLFEYILKNTGAKYVFGLCYYSTAMYGLNLACLRRGVVAIDMQHGGQGDLHPSYYFKKIPKNGYSILPKIFWTWDKLSYDNIKKWTNNTKHTAILGGNPWIDFQREKKLDSNEIYKGEKPMILFTLQLLTEPLDNYLLKVVMETSSDFNWWLRLHPRMSSNELEGIKRKLTDYGIYNDVNYIEATKWSLPNLLKSCTLHISKYSGAIGEAALMGKRTLIIDQIGVETYKDLILSKMAVECVNKDPVDMINIIREEVENISLGKINMEFNKISFKNVIDEFVK
jgi:hypothetical protein|tara:strand:- start:321 stop:1781 length:1461 start_codon:yes stop_codon:yes gene_type:complete